MSRDYKESGSSGEVSDQGKKKEEDVFSREKEKFIREKVVKKKKPFREKVFGFFRFLFLAFLFGVLTSFVFVVSRPVWESVLPEAEEKIMTWLHNEPDQVVIPQDTEEVKETTPARTSSNPPETTSSARSTEAESKDASSRSESEAEQELPQETPEEALTGDQESTEQTLLPEPEGPEEEAQAETTSDEIVIERDTDPETDEPESTGSKDSDTKGPDAEGPNSKGSDTEGPNAEGSDTEDFAMEDPGTGIVSDQGNKEQTAETGESMTEEESEKASAGADESKSEKETENTSVSTGESKSEKETENSSVSTGENEETGKETENTSASAGKNEETGKETEKASASAGKNEETGKETEKASAGEGSREAYETTGARQENSTDSSAESSAVESAALSEEEKGEEQTGKEPSLESKEEAAGSAEASEEAGYETEDPAGPSGQAEDGAENTADLSEKTGDESESSSEPSEEAGDKAENPEDPSEETEEGSKSTGDLSEENGDGTENPAEPSEETEDWTAAEDYEKILTNALLYMSETALDMNCGVVSIQAVDGTGTEEPVAGLIWNRTEKDYYLLFDGSTVRGSTSFLVTFYNGQTVTASLKGSDDVTGIAVAVIERTEAEEAGAEESWVIPLGNSYKVKAGAMVTCIGSPMGPVFSVSCGMISYISLSNPGIDTDLRLLYSDISVAGDGTGFLMNMDGELVGVITHSTAQMSGSSYSAAIAISDLKPVLQTLANGRRLSYLGIQGVNVTSQLAEENSMPVGIYVTDSLIGAPAYNAGVQSGDIITEVDGTPVETLRDLQDVLADITAGEKIEICVQRQGRNGYVELTFDVTLGSRSSWLS